MNINGGFPPIEYIKISTGDTKINKNELKKERFYAMIPKKNLNIRQILNNNNIKQNMINTPKPDVEIVKSF